MNGMRIRHKFLVLLLAAGGLPLAIAVALHSLSFFAASKDAALAALTKSAQQLARRLDEVMLGTTRDLRALADDDHVLEPDLAHVSIHLARFTYVFPYVKDLFWVDRGGSILAASNKQLVGARLTDLYADLDDELAQAVRGTPGQLVISDLDDVSASRRHSVGAALATEALDIQYLLRLDDQHGDFKGVLVAVLSSQLLVEILRDAAAGNVGGLPVLLLNAKGEVLASSDSGASVLVPHAWVPSGGLEQGVRTVAGRDASGERRYAAVAGMRGLGTPRALEWQVVLQVPEHVLTTPVVRSLGWTVLAMISLLPLTVLAAVVISRSVNRRLDTLDAAVREVGKHNFGVRVAAHGTDELASLGRAFNTALDEVEATHAKLEQELAQRERSMNELAAANARLADRNREVDLRNQLGDLLQSCLTTREVGAVVARFFPLLLPGSCGAVYAFARASDALALVAQWGPEAPPAALTPTDCWALRRGKVHRSSGDSEGTACPHTAAPSAGAAICIPLAAHDQPLGVLHLFYSGAGAPAADGHDAETLAAALAGQVGVALANVRLLQARARDVTEGVEAPEVHA